jgi:hypothetical protein
MGGERRPRCSQAYNRRSHAGQGVAVACPAHPPPARPSGNRRHDPDRGRRRHGAFWWPTRRRRSRWASGLRRDRGFDFGDRGDGAGDRARRPPRRARRRRPSRRAAGSVTGPGPARVRAPPPHLENGTTGLLTATGWTSFTAAGPASREARLRAWQTSRIALFRTGFQAMKRLCGACYYSSPAAWPAIGYPGPPDILA